MQTRVRGGRGWSRATTMRQLWIPFLGVALVAVPQPDPARYARCLDGVTPKHEWSLPKAFREVSGLALASDGRLFLHADEFGVVGALDPATGRLVGTFHLGPPVPRADFEGIAVADSQLILVTSQGILFKTK